MQPIRDPKESKRFDDEQFYTLILENNLIKYCRVIEHQYVDPEMAKRHIFARLKEFHASVEERLQAYMPSLPTREELEKENEFPLGNKGEKFTPKDSPSIY